MDMKLNEKQRLFCDEYLKDRNGKQAAIRAGYSPKTAESQASRLLSNAKVSVYLAEQTAKRSEKLQIDAEWVLREAADLYAECRLEHDRTQANKCLDTIGKHVDVQAFLDRAKVEVGATEEMLAAMRETTRRVMLGDK